MISPTGTQTECDLRGQEQTEFAADSQASLGLKELERTALISPAVECQQIQGKLFLEVDDGTVS
ncbi:MAG: hypothetical protein DMG05_12905 [Acidobacteria bacterium]|nr:MAG: hypothetical protein DMG05_12905 [Acidobacteriota bacterium]